MAFRQRKVAEREYVWLDAVHFDIRLEDDRLSTLVMIAARPNGEKELLALAGTSDQRCRLRNQGNAEDVQVPRLAQRRWRRLDAAYLLPFVAAGAKFVEATRQKRRQHVPQPTEQMPREAA
jgi:hypothetical protein